MKVVLGQNNRGPSQNKPLKRYGGEGMLLEIESEREVAQLCSTLSDPMDCSPPGSSIHGIFQASVLEWGAIGIISHTSKVMLKILQVNLTVREP